MKQTTSSLMGLDAAAAILGVTRRTFERLVARGEIKAIRLPGVRRVLVHRDDVDAVIARVREPRPARAK